MYDINQILAEVKTERERQIVLWGHVPDKRVHYFISVLTEEVGEMARAALEGKREDLYEESIQVAAVACQIAQYIETMAWGN